MNKDLIYIVIISLITVFSINNCQNKNNDISRYKSNVKALKDSVIYFKNEKGQTVATKLALQLTEKELKIEKKTNEDLKIALKKFKKPKVIVQTKQTVKIDTIYVPYKEEIPCSFTRLSEVKEENYSFNILSNEKGNEITNFALKPNKQTIIVGDKKNSIFKNRELRIDITNSNKLFNQKEIKPIIIVYKKSWHEKAYITIPLGAILGIALF